MSTRCQVQVIQERVEWVPWEQKITLYHHCDGYPEAMLPLFAEAYDKAVQCLQACQDEMLRRYPSLRGRKDELDTWELGRAGKAASFLCYAQPGQFEPTEDREVPIDLEFFYELYVSGGVWEVEVFDMPGMKVLQPRLAVLMANHQWSATECKTTKEK